MEEEIEALAPLSDPTRRRLYLYVASRPQGAGREEAAEAAGVSRALAAFHLDRLVEAELLIAEYRRLTGRSGPGAGRTAKIYQRSPRRLAFSLPQRNYEMLARLLAKALTSSDGASSETLTEGARQLGMRLGARAREQAGPRAGRRRLLAAAETVLDDCGFEATRGEGPCLLQLRNCPFSPLSGEFTELVCTMNLALMQALLAELGVKGVRTDFDPTPGRCCAVFREQSRVRNRRGAEENGAAGGEGRQ